MTHYPKVLRFASVRAEVFLLLGLCFATPSFGQRYWDINGTISGASANNVAPGTWGVNNFWSTSSSGTATTATWTPGQQAVFSAGANATGAFTVAVSGNQSASGIVFEEGTVTLSGGTLTLTSGVGKATLSVASTNFATIASQLAGANGLIKSGTGTLLLSGTNSYSGVTDLKAGTLLVGKPSSLGSSSLDLDGGTFGASGGPVVLNNAVTLGASSTIAGSQNITFTGNFLAAGGALTLTIQNTAQTTFAGSSFSLSNPNKQGTVTLNVAGGNVSITGTVVNGAGSGSDGMIKNGSGSLLLSGNNTFTGNMEVDAGTLILGNDSAAGLGTLILGNGVTLAATNGPRTITNNLTFTGDVTFAGPDSLTFQHSLNLGGDRIFTVLNTTIFNGVISGSYSLSKNGYDTLILNGANTFGSSSKCLSVNAGTVAFGNNSAAGKSANVLVLNGGAVQASGAARSLANPIVVSNNSTIGGNLNLTFSGNASNLGGNHTLSVSNSALTSFSGSTFSLAGPNSPATLTLDVSASSGGLTLSSTIQNGSGTGVGSLIKNGSGNLTLAGVSANSFSGGLTVNNGTVTAAKLNALGSGPLTLNGGTVDLTTFNQSLGSFTLAGGSLNGSRGTLTASSIQAQSGTVNASLAGAAAFTKSTAGTVSLNASNSFTGGATLNAGTLWVNNPAGSGTGSGSVSVNNSATLGGTGTILGRIILNSGATLSPGTTAPGSFNSVNESWNSGSTFLVKIKDTAAGEGTGWDLLKITGSLTIGTSTGNPLFVDLHSLALNNAAGSLYNYNNSMSYNWRIITTTAGITFNSGQNVNTAFDLLLGNFNNNTGGGHFSLNLANNNKDLVLSFTPAQVPEPKTRSMIALGFLLLFARRWSFSRR